MLARVRSRFARAAASSGFPRSVLALFLVLAIALGLLLSWAFTLSVQVGSESMSVVDSSTDSVQRGGRPVLTEANVGSNVQLIIDTGTLQTPADFDVNSCMREVGITNSVLMLEEVSWSTDGPAWLIVHGYESLNTYRADGGNVQAAIVRSTCGENAPAEMGDGPGLESPSVLWSGSVVVGPVNR